MEGSMWRVRSLAEKRCGYGNYLTCSYENLRPVPLTPEILEKCGAVKVEGEWQFKVAICALWISFRFHASHCYSEIGGIYLGGQIKYVHQLQNLYFALTGTELEVKL